MVKFPSFTNAYVTLTFVGFHSPAGPGQPPLGLLQSPLPGSSPLQHLHSLYTSCHHPAFAFVSSVTV